MCFWHAVLAVQCWLAMARQKLPANTHKTHISNGHASLTAHSFWTPADAEEAECTLAMAMFQGSTWTRPSAALLCTAATQKLHWKMSRQVGAVKA